MQTEAETFLGAEADGTILAATYCSTLVELMFVVQEANLVTCRNCLSAMAKDAIGPGQTSWGIRERL